MNPSADTQELPTSHPTGWGAFLFTDLEGSTSSWEATPARMHEALAEHDRILREVFVARGGTVFFLGGDSFGVHFTSIADAVTAAIEGQRCMRDADRHGIPELKVRMGVHAGVAYRRDADNWFGPCLNRSARVMSAGHGGQVLVTEAVAQDLRLAGPEGIDVVPRGLHRLNGIPEPVALFQVAVGDLPQDFPPPKSLTGPSTPIPTPPTSFLGREDDLRATREAVLGPAPVVTIVAPGGTGKTRLAYEAARELGPDLGGAAFLVELADASETDVGDRIAASVLGDDPLARIEAEVDPVAAVVSRLRRQQALLVLDNCEEVRESLAAAASAIVGACPEVTVLATSRLPLGIPGEQVLPLRPLPVGGEAGPGPAVQLFVDRATSARSDIDLDDEQMEAVEAVCRVVDGVPLGVELAAARTATWLPSEMLPHLDQALRVLTDRSAANRPERQRSVRATIRWSYDQLDESSQELLQLCAAYSGGFDGAAVADIGRRVLDLDELDVADALQSLVELSLMTAWTTAGATRYRPAEPIRQFAAAQMEASGRTSDAAAAYVAWYQGVARSYVPTIDEAPDPAVISRLRLEHENFLLAIGRAEESGNRAVARRLAVSLHNYWEETGHIATAKRLLAGLLGVAPGATSSEDLHRVLAEPAGAQGAGLLTTYACMAGELPLAQQLSEELAFLLDAGLPPKVVAALAFTLGFVDRAGGDDERCDARWALAGESALAGDDLLLARQAFWSAAYSNLTSGRLEAASEMLGRARAVPLDSAGWFPHHAQLMADAILLGDPDHDPTTTDEALSRLDRNGRAVDDLGLRFRTLLAASVVSPQFFRFGRLEEARWWWRRGLELSHDSGHLWGAWVMLECTAWDRAQEGRHRDAAELWGTVDRFAEERGYRQWNLIREESDPRRAAARDADPQGFAEAWRRGADRLGLSKVVMHALEET